MITLKIHKTIGHSQRTLDAIDKFCDAVLGKGYNKLEQWRRGEIDRVNPEDVSTLNWGIYLSEEAERTYNNWLKKNPNYFEDKNNSGGSSFLSMFERLEEAYNAEKEKNNIKDEE